MLIRKMTPADVATVASIEATCFSQPWSEKSFQDSIQRDDTIFLVCELTDERDMSVQSKQDTVLAGYIGMYLSFEEANIVNVAVSSEYRKKGFGEALIAGAKQHAKGANIENIFLEVRVSNEPAISLYEKMGFENLGIRKKFYEHPVEDAYIMSCDLT